MGHIKICVALLFGSVAYAQATDSASTLCNTVKYSVFGEPEKTFRDCMDAPGFVVITSINGRIIKSLGVGLELPSTAQDIYASEAVTTVVQVLKAKDRFLVRAQIVRNHKSFMIVAPMNIGDTTTKNISGDQYSVTLLANN